MTAFRFSLKIYVVTPGLRPCYDLPATEKWANCRNNLRLVAEVVRLVAEVVGDRKGQISIMGITLSTDLTWKRHVDNIVKKAEREFTCRPYMLYQLKRAGVNRADLITIYISVVRPVVEYACPVWNTNLPIYLSDNIEMIQKRAVRAIFPGMNYDDILTHINLSTLKDRRDYLCNTYFTGMDKLVCTPASNSLIACPGGTVSRLYRHIRQAAIPARVVLGTVVF